MKLRNVEYLVFLENMPKVLLSRPILQSLCFKIDENFANVREKYSDMVISSVVFNPVLIQEAKEPGILATIYGVDTASKILL